MAIPNLTASQKIMVGEYLRLYHELEHMTLICNEDAVDVYKMISFKVQCRHMRERLHEIYKTLPQCLKDQNLIPTIKCASTQF